MGRGRSKSIACRMRKERADLGVGWRSREIPGPLRNFARAQAQKVADMMNWGNILPRHGGCFPSTMRPGALPTILLAEGEKETRDLVKALLAPHGYRVREASTGWELLTALQVERPSLIILGAGTPGIDTLRAAEEISANPHSWHVPVLLVGATDWAAVARARGLRVQCQLPKPLACLDLLQAVHAMTEPFRRLN